MPSLCTNPLCNGRLAVVKKERKFMPFRATYKKLIDDCTSGSAPSPCIEISLHRIAH